MESLTWDSQALWQSDDSRWDGTERRRRQREGAGLALGVGDAEILDIAVQRDGCLVAVGRAQAGSLCKMAVVRYQPDGRLDLGLGGEGILFPSDGTGRQVCIQFDGRILVAGQVDLPEGPRWKILRLLQNGSPDPSFGEAGEIVLPCEPLDASMEFSLQTDGKLVLSGNGRFRGGAEGYLVVRLHASGRVDDSFGLGGWARFRTH